MNNMEIKVSVKDVPEVIEKLEWAEKTINDLQSKIDKAIKYNKEVLTWTTNEPITDEIAYKNLEILEDKGKDK